MSVLRHFIIIGILTVGVIRFSCTSPNEAPSPESTEINSHTDSLLQFKIYLEQARISRFKGENQEEAHFLEAAESIAQYLNDSSVYANLWQEKAMLYLPHQSEKAKEFFQKALAICLPELQPPSHKVNFTFPAFIWNKDRRTVLSITSIMPSAKICRERKLPPYTFRRATFLPIFCKLTRPRIISCLFCLMHP